VALIAVTNYSLLAAIAMARKGRDDKLLATPLSTAPEERTGQQTSLHPKSRRAARSLL